VSPIWLEGGAAFCYAQGSPENTTIQCIDVRTGTQQSMFDVRAVRAALSAQLGYPPAYSGLPFDTFNLQEEGWVGFECEGVQWRLHVESGKLERTSAASALFGLVPTVDLRTPHTWTRRIGGSAIEAVEVREQLSPDGEWFARIECSNITLRSAVDGRERRLTTCGTEDRFWDIESDRMGSLQGLHFVREVVHTLSPWSADSLTLLAYRRDITGVFRIPCIHWLKPFEEVDYVPFQKAGAKLHRIEPVLVDVLSGRQIQVGLADVEDRHIQWLGWHPDGSEALLIVYARELTRVEIVAVNREDGSIRALMTEYSDTAVKIQIEEVFAGDHGFHVLPDGSGFLWTSTRDGWNHLYRYDWSGRLRSQLTTGDWPVYRLERVGEDGFVYFTAARHCARPYDVHICRVPLDGGHIEQLTQESGIHSPSFGPGSQAFLDTHSSVSRPTRTDLVKSDGTRLVTVAEMNISGLQAVGYAPPEEFTVKSVDGTTDLWGVLYKPFNFDPGHRYPVIECIYGGPQIIYAQRFFSVNPSPFLNLCWALAQLGYITVCLDARGTPGRSKAFQDAVVGDWTVGVLDHANGIRELCERHPWMDVERVGIYGHSWGGYFATSALMQAPDVYQAAVAYEPGYDPWQYIISEPYLGVPQSNRTRYDKADLIKRAKEIKRPLMILTGTRYTRVVSSAMKMTRALIEAGVDHEVVIVPEATHFFVGVEEEYLHMKLTGWFDRHIRNHDKNDKRVPAHEVGGPIGSAQRPITGPSG
jgi:dipeptidyl-peptidase 4